VLSLVLRELESWSGKLREEQMLRAFESRVLRRKFKPVRRRKEEAVRVAWKKKICTQLSNL
jgi:hypothetical protein